MQSSRTRQAAFWLIVTGMAFFAMAASNPQCARTSETALAPGLGAQAADGACSQDCIDTFQEAKKAEQARYKDAMSNCNGDEACREAESATHNSIVAELVADKDNCIVNCSHQQGTGVGGQ